MHKNTEFINNHNVYLSNDKRVSMLFIKLTGNKIFHDL